MMLNNGLRVLLVSWGSVYGPGGVFMMGLLFLAAYSMVKDFHHPFG